MPWSRLFAPRADPPPARLPEGLRVYAIGDVHGCDELLAAMEQRIAADLRQHPVEGEAMVIFLGDYVDRGPASCAVIERLLTRRFAGLPARFLAGNHEEVMLAFLADPFTAADWLDWGGRTTLASYGVALPEEVDEPALGNAAAALGERLPLVHRDFLETLEPMIELGGFVFVHAGLRPGVALERQRRHDMLWIREPFLVGKRRVSHRVVHGHTISEQVEVLPHRIGVDTGAFSTGVLSAVAIDGEEVRIVPD